MNDTDWEFYLNELIKYCLSQQIQIVFEKGPLWENYDSDTQTIQINTQRTKENQVYILLHEIGHYKIFKDEFLSEKFAPLLEKKKCNLSNQILELEEEIMAWHLGEKIARMFYIPLDLKYQVLKSKCLKTYIRQLRTV